MKRMLIGLVLFAAWAPAGARAQEGEPSFALLVKSPKPAAALAVGKAFGQIEEPALLADGEHYVILVDTEGLVTTRPGQGDVGLVEMTAHPGVLMDLFAEQVDSARAVAQMAMGMGLGQASRNPAAVARLADAIFDSPRQIAVANLRIDTDGSNSYHGVLDLTPAAGSGLASIIDRLRPGPAGVPVLAETAMVNMSVSIDPAVWREFSGSLLEFYESFLGIEASSMAPAMNRYIELMDGAISVGIDPAGGMTMLMGLTDPQAMAAFLASEEYRKVAEESMAKIDFMTGTFTQNAFEHEGVAVHRVVVEMDTDLIPPSPLFPGGAMEEYLAVAGEFLFLRMGAASDQGIRALIDRAQAGMIARAAPSPGRLLSLTMNVADLVAQAGEELPPDAPGTAAMHLGVADGVLRMDVTVR